MNHHSRRTDPPTLTVALVGLPLLTGCRSDGPEAPASEASASTTSQRVEPGVAAGTGWNGSDLSGEILHDLLEDTGGFSLGLDNGLAGLPSASTLDPSAGAFYSDGTDGDVRARTEQLFDRHLGALLRGEPTRDGQAALLRALASVRCTPLSGARPDEELWIIPRDRAVPPVPRGESGGIIALGSDGTATPIPLIHTEARARIAAFIATVEMKQRFRNPFTDPIEAVYAFALPDDAAVNDFVMTIGDRRIRGIIRERAEAERIYAEARRQGHTASLLSALRPNIFMQRVANIAPGHEIGVELRYFHTLRHDDGWFRFVYPMTIGPRFSPPGSDAERELAQIPSPVLPDERPGTTIELTVELDAGASLDEVACSTHRILRHPDGSRRVTVSLAPDDRIPNRDFVLSFRVAGDTIAPSLLTERTAEGGAFTLLVHPPADLRSLHRQPVEMIFVVDTSGSMEGTPLEQARGALRAALEMMRPTDSFQIVRFSEDSSSLGDSPVLATRQNVDRARRWVDGLSSGGGTHMMRGLRAALTMPHDAERLRVIAFLTDGFIGNDDEIVGEIGREVGEARIFSFGVGSSPNRSLMHRMARLGRGTVAFLGTEDRGGAVMGAFFRRISHPALCDLKIDWGGARVHDVYPKCLPDLWVGRPVAITGRFDGDLPPEIRVSGTSGGRRIHLPVIATSETSGPAQRGIGAVWARRKIADLADAATHASDPHGELASEITRTALDHHLVSAYTAFVAVDAKSRLEDGTAIEVPVSLPTPAGTTFGQR